ncbi:hypothetical protein ScalyP_jg294, partial [Parmales sp. scaly parma]
GGGGGGGGGEEDEDEDERETKLRLLRNRNQGFLEAMVSSLKSFQADGGGIAAGGNAGGDSGASASDNQTAGDKDSDGAEGGDLGSLVTRVQSFLLAAAFFDCTAAAAAPSLRPQRGKKSRAKTAAFALRSGSSSSSSPFVRASCRIRSLLPLSVRRSAGDLFFSLVGSEAERASARGRARGR